jgi:general secretion pathway protein B
VSFILDALRKSESERQRDAAPSVTRIPEAVPVPKLPVWATGAITVLILGVAGLGAALWLTAGRPTADETAPASVAASTLSGAGDAAQATPDSRDGPAAGEARSAAAAPRPADTPRDVSRERPSEPGLAAPPVPAQSGAGLAAATSQRLAAAPAASPTRATPPSGFGTTAPPVAEFVPSYEQAAARDASLPKLQLEFHAYAADPSRRFVFINGEKYEEGTTLSEGPRVIRITPDGVVLAIGGQQLLLGRP